MNTTSRVRLLIAIAGLAAPLALGQTITVDVTDGDLIDINPDSATIADLPGPDGHISFSEAMIASNNTPGRQTIAFAIPTGDWTYLSWYYPGRAVIHGMMFYANAYDEVTIDGRTQTAFTGDTNPDGHEVVILRGGGLYIAAGNCTVRGLDNTVVYIEGSGCLIEENSVMGIEIYGGLGGSGALVRNNTGGGNLKIDQSINNTVTGNTFDRVRVLGWIAGGRPAANNRIGGPALADRNHIIGLGTVSEHGIPGGFGIQLFDSIGTTIENNWIGMAPDGMSQGHPATTMGIYFDSENHDTVIRNNRIAGVLAVARPPHAPSYLVGTAIQIYGAGGGVSIIGNKIGLNANDEPVLGSITGITTTNYYLGPVQNVTIGSNEIAGHLQAGIGVANTFSGFRISGNSIHDNGGLGIDLITMGFEAGVTPNDPLDADTGGNGLQNFPVLAGAEAGPGSVRITGTLDSSATASFTLEFFASPACDSTGYGEGEMYIGAASVTTSASGHADFDIVLPGAIPVDSYITATATKALTGDTSEFSACVAVTGGACPADFTGDGLVDFADYLEFLNLYDALDPRADLNGDGLIDFADYLGFLNLYEAGC